MTAAMPCRPVFCGDYACHINKAMASLPKPETGLPQPHISQLGAQAM